jgi:hypothetical protein
METENRQVKDIVEFTLNDKTAIPVEVDDLNYDFTKISTEGGRQADEHRVTRSFQEALERVKPVADQLINKLRELASEPEHIEVEFGVKLSGEVGALIASTSTEANFTVKLSWSNTSAQPEEANRIESV